MSKASVYEAKTESFIQPILDSMNFELVDVEYVKEGGMNYLRAYIDKEGGITVDDCEVVARQMNEILDREDYIPDSYTFEVSSPGLGRPLKKEKDYVRNIAGEFLTMPENIRKMVLEGVDAVMTDQKGDSKSKLRGLYYDKQYI